jgi:hypothetical protein
MRCIVRSRQWVVIVIISMLIILSQTACCTLCPEKHALPIPGAASRSPDFELPLSDRNYRLAMLYLANIQFPDPRDPAIEEDIAEQYEHLDAEITRKFQPILVVLSEGIPTSDDLDAKGRIGVLFSSKGADGKALDSRFQGQIMSEDIRVGTLHGYYFVFYNRYPWPNDSEADDREKKLKDAHCGGKSYCRLVIVNEVSIRRY